MKLLAGALIVFFYSSLISLTQADPLIQAEAPDLNFHLNEVYSNSECLSCHKKINPDLVKAWQNSSHSERSDERIVNKTSLHKKTSEKTNTACIQCHGASHNDALVKSRSDSTCINCHGGNTSPVVHSYSTSKHGAIMIMTKKKVDWNKPLKSANYRVPGCAYCHMYNTQHNTKETIRKKDKTYNGKAITTNSFKTNPSKTNLSKTNPSKINSEDLRRKTLSVCSNCHAQGYIRRLFQNGERMLMIAGKKINEAQILVDEVVNNQIEHPKKQSLDNSISTHIEAIKKQFHKMQTHYKNVYLGVAHQSPDYQWWHGQPALDGDLLKIKTLISDLQRKEKINSVSQ